MEVKVTYLTNSGFLLSLADTLFVIDDEGKAKDIVDRAVAAHKKAVFFATHAHFDHFSDHIFGYGKRYVLSDDIDRAACPAEADIARIKKGDTVEVCGYRVTAFDSTDAGVSLLIERDGKRIFHAGDLNNWHWRDESTDEEVEEMQVWFDGIVSCLPHGIDLAFFPADPRMGGDYALGARQFAERIEPKRLIPMHFRESTYAAHDLKTALGQSETAVIPLTAAGESITISL